MTAISWSAPIGGEPGVSYIIQYHTGLPTNRAPKKQGSQQRGLPKNRSQSLLLSVSLIFVV
jgi:hypothetical protein